MMEAQTRDPAGSHVVAMHAAADARPGSGALAHAFHTPYQVTSSGDLACCGSRWIQPHVRRLVTRLTLVHRAVEHAANTNGK